MQCRNGSTPAHISVCTVRRPIQTTGPNPGRTVDSVREDLADLHKRFKTSGALLRLEGRPVFYVYDSYRLPAAEWAQLFTAGGDKTVRGTELDGGWREWLVWTPKSTAVVSVAACCVVPHESSPSVRPCSRSPHRLSSKYELPPRHLHRFNPERPGHGHRDRSGRL
jgi:hypothetical protein